MYRTITAVAVSLVALFSLLPAVASAQDMPAGEHKTIGLGFHDVEAPVGVRWWLAGQKVGIDLGLGYATDSESAQLEGYPDESTSSWAISVGVPIVLKSWSRVHFLFRPGLFYETEEFVTSTFPAPFETADVKTMRITGELEAEVFLMENMSVSASHGIGYQSIDVEGVDDKITSFSTLGNNFTEIGFHVYLFGSGSH